MSLRKPSLSASASATPDPGCVRIMGIDPGSQRTGIGIIDVDAGGHAQLVFHTTVSLLDNATFALRLKRIFDEICTIVAEHRPAEVAIERVFMARNADSALKLGQARGAAICAAVHTGLSVSEYAAREIKQSVTGGGGAEKRQVQHMVGILLNTAQKLQADAADALAIALTHAHTRTTARRIGATAAAAQLLVAERGGRRRRGARAAWPQP